MHFFDRVYKELVEFSNDTGNDNQAQVEECIRYCCVLVITNLKDHRIWSYCDDIIGNYWTMTIMGQSRCHSVLLTTRNLRFGRNSNSKYRMRMSRRILISYGFDGVTSCMIRKRKKLHTRTSMSQTRCSLPTTPPAWLAALQTSGLCPCSVQQLLAPIVTGSLHQVQYQGVHSIRPFQQVQ